MENDSMEYRSLGRSGLKASILGFGNGNIFYQEKSGDLDYHLINRCIRAGINFLDTAEIYAHGQAEIDLARNIHRGEWDRDDLIISTKLSPRVSEMFGNSKKRLKHGIMQILERLQLENVDVLYLHRPEYDVPLIEQVRTMSQFVDDDYTYYWGTSEFSPSQLMEIHSICEKYGLNHPITEQCEYNMLERENLEVVLSPIIDQWGTGIAVYSPLAGGVLSGVYNGGVVPPNSRYSYIDKVPLLTRYYNKYINSKPDKGVATLKSLQNLAEELGCTQSQLALAWVAKSLDVSIAIFAASSIRQLEENLGSLGVIKGLDDNTLQRIEDILKNRPISTTNSRTFQLNRPRR